MRPEQVLQATKEFLKTTQSEQLCFILYEKVYKFTTRESCC